MKNLSEIFERLIWKITSGRFIMTVVVSGVYAYLAMTGVLKEDRIMEITLVVLYAYFNIPRPNETNGTGRLLPPEPTIEDEESTENKESK